MTLDITNPEHREALRVASTCMLLDKARTRDEWIAHCSDEPLALAFEALSDPAKAAELIRRLVERVGASSLFDERELAVSGLKVLGYVFIAWDEWHVWVNECGIPAFIARLLAIVPGAGADAVLAALRGGS